MMTPLKIRYPTSKYSTVLKDGGQACIKTGNSLLLASGGFLLWPQNCNVILGSTSLSLDISFLKRDTISCFSCKKKEFDKNVNRQKKTVLTSKI